ncbi:biopolymer transporter ExbD [Jannaschia marina]|uniref:biopolymer transporter ExbD n=1 Tax=Jannaschia marina TaxID=2741674 RepID=UPI0015CEA45F|nr:biopolymer transporter ExbD [Jannaschia marina]
MSRRSLRRRALSLTPLVDVIFLLLLFFMLTSTFSRYGEVEIAAATGGAGAAPAGELRFLHLGSEEMYLAGRAVTFADLTETLPGTTTLVSLAEGVEAQRLIDLMGAMRGVPDLRLTVLR